MFGSRFELSLRMQVPANLPLAICSSCKAAIYHQHLYPEDAPLRRCRWCREAAYCSPDCRHDLDIFCRTG